MPSIPLSSAMPHSAARALARLVRACALGVLAVAGSGAALAQAAADPSTDLGPLTQRWLDDAMARWRSPRSTRALP